MTTQPLLISGGRIIDPIQGLDKVGDLLISGGEVRWLGEPGQSPRQEQCDVINATGLIVCPGFVDLHCHLREPGFEDKETIASGTRAAARGGFTTVCCMPNTNPALDTRSGVEYVKRNAAEQGVVRVLVIGCITKGRKGKELAEMAELAEAGAVAVSDDGDTVENSRLMRHALDYSVALGLPVIEHCQDAVLSHGGVMNEGWVSSLLGLRGIPAAAEEIVISRDLALATLTGAKLHIAHVSTAGSVELVRRAKEKGIPVSAEVTPHHLTLTEERVMGESWQVGKPLPLSAYDTNAKVNPPLRTQKDIDALVQGLKDGVIGAIATDHAPHTLVDKLCEFDQAASGISGLETALGSLMSLVHSGKLDIVTLISKMTVEPARLINQNLGTLKAGLPADVTIIDPKAEWEVEPAKFASKGKNTPLAGSRLKGKVMATIVAGNVVYKDSTIPLEAEKASEEAKVRG